MTIEFLITFVSKFLPTSSADPHISKEPKQAIGDLFFRNRHPMYDSWRRKSDHDDIPRYLSWWRKTAPSCTKAQAKEIQRRLLSVCQDHRVSSHVPRGTLKIQAEGNFNMIVATEQIFYTSKNNMLFLVNWHILAWFPAWKSSNFSTLNLWCHLGLPKELKKQTHDVLSWNLVFKTNTILCKTQPCPLV